MARNAWGTTIKEPRPMTAAMRRALAQGTVAPDTPDTDNPGLLLADTRQEPHWIDNVHFRPTMKVRGHKPKNRKANSLHGTNRPRYRSDKRDRPAVQCPPTVASLMRRSGYIVRPEKDNRQWDS